MPERSVYFMVVDICNPAAEPFAVMRLDMTKRRGTGVEAVVESLHWSRAEADRSADALNRVTERGAADG